MNPIRALARPMLAAAFVAEGIDALSDPAAHAKGAEDLAGPLRESAPALADVDTETLVRAEGAVQVVGGALLAIGKLPRVSSTVLAAVLVPSTVIRHRFWEAADDDTRRDQQAHFVKNVSLLGGLLIAAMDTQGRPGLAWRAEHALERAGASVERTRREARLARKLAKAEAQRTRGRMRRRAASTAERTRREARLAAKLAKSEARRAGAEVRRGVSEAKRTLTPDVTDAVKAARRLRELASD